MGSRRKPAALLHIGVEKTGSSSLQKFLAFNRAKLLQNGFFYPEFCGEISHTRLAVYAGNDDVFEDLQAEEGISTADEVHRFRLKFETVAAAELSENQFETAIFSGEHCSSRIRDRNEKIRLKEFMQDYFDSCKVIVYLRRQDRLLVSHYSTHLKGGGTGLDVLKPRGKPPVFLDYHGLLESWSDVFGRENIIPRIYDRSELFQGSVVDDFAHYWKLGDGYSQVKDANESILPGAQELLRQLNQDYPLGTYQTKHPIHRNIFQILVRHFAGRGRLPAREEAMSLCEKYAVSNANVQKEWFPERAQLFDPDFSFYPEQPADARTTFSDAVEVSKLLWRQRSSRKSVISTQAQLIRMAVRGMVR